MVIAVRTAVDSVAKNGQNHFFATLSGAVHTGVAYDALKFKLY
jgi:hypothetical protein